MSDLETRLARTLARADRARRAEALRHTGHLGANLAVAGALCEAFDIGMGVQAAAQKWRGRFIWAPGCGLATRVIP